MVTTSIESCLRMHECTTPSTLYSAPRDRNPLCSVLCTLFGDAPVCCILCSVLCTQGALYSALCGCVTVEVPPTPTWSVRQSSRGSASLPLAACPRLAWARFALPTLQLVLGLPAGRLCRPLSHLRLPALPPQPGVIGSQYRAHVCNRRAWFLVDQQDCNQFLQILYSTMRRCTSRTLPAGSGRPRSRRRRPASPP